MQESFVEDVGSVRLFRMFNPEIDISKVSVEKSSTRPVARKKKKKGCNMGIKRSLKRKRNKELKKIIMSSK